jgi:hypothetical protein
MDERADAMERFACGHISNCNGNPRRESSFWECHGNNARGNSTYGSWWRQGLEQQCAIDRV